MNADFFSWERFADVFPKVLVKLPVTFEIVLMATVIGLCLGTILAMIRIKKIPVLNQIAFLMISFFRGTPALVQMFIVYYGTPLLFRSVFGIDLSGADKLLFVFITFGLNQTFRRIVFPQALKVAIPGLETMFVTLFQDTALAYMIGVADMMGKVKLIAASTRHSMEGYVGVAIIFAVISLLLEEIFTVVNRRMAHERKASI